jgi:hypothetical protein
MTNQGTITTSDTVIFVMCALLGLVVMALLYWMGGGEKPDHR